MSQIWKTLGAWVRPDPKPGLEQLFCDGQWRSLLFVPDDGPAEPDESGVSSLVPSDPAAWASGSFIRF